MNTQCLEYRVSQKYLKVQTDKKPIENIAWRVFDVEEGIKNETGTGEDKNNGGEGE
jgi:hypothetical protein